MINLKQLRCLFSLSRSNPLCQGEYIFEADDERTNNSIEYRQNRIYRPDEPLRSRYMDTPFPDITEEHPKYFESSFNDYMMIGPKKNSATSYDAEEFYQENNNIEETECPFEIEKYNNTHSMQETIDSKLRKDSLSLTSATNVMKVPEYSNKNMKTSLHSKPSFPLSPWNQSITLEDKVQRFLAQAAELAHQNTKITSEHSTKSPGMVN